MTALPISCVVSDIPEGRLKAPKILHLVRTVIYSYSYYMYVASSTTAKAAGDVFAFFVRTFALWNESLDRSTEIATILVVTNILTNSHKHNLPLR